MMGFVVGTSSLDEARELYGLLTECDALFDRVETKSLQTTKSIAVLLTTLNTVVSVLRRMNLGEEYDDIIMRVQRIIQLLFVLRTSLMAAHAAAGPLGWIAFGAGAVGTVLTAEDIVATVFSG